MLVAYRQHVAERAALGIPPLPLSPKQTEELVALLRSPPKGEEQFLVELITHRVPAGVDDAAKVKAEFLDKIMKMDAGKYTTAWTKKSFRDGSTPPAVKGGDGEVVEFLKHTPGGCGYMMSAPPAGLSPIGKL